MSTNEDDHERQRPADSASGVSLPAEIPLGRQSATPERYDAGLLCPIERRRGARQRYGFDLWTCYELSWLTADGRPQLAALELEIPAASPHIVESKSLKLYLSGLNHERFESRAALQTLIEGDLSRCVSAPVRAQIEPLERLRSARPPFPGRSLDEAPLLPQLTLKGGPEAAHLSALPRGPHGSYAVYSHLFRSLCPVTAQPDWGSLLISYEGDEIAPGALLSYLLSFRNHQGFHEQCVEQIFDELSARCALERLEVFALYLRRGGIDINPCRSSHPVASLRRPLLPHQ